ncbi:hypothetical protein J3458_004485 [Metarhizium acridum]|uniref:Uncharacterized protein n=1 Tax=Metarhizium acridum (strain CQMa 102) TaxID=655827 RepID=E9DU71_METAQ|nr:uncharacterized protein MAC_01169 [Metarhizium acridum CQMa 102]EFY92931.1 hypothetical protein MAC_01169 [Metarhizium acridum CQMa 102]KAG8419630.1 hypothetical protein J3458_004485 [Metarhizium acridum]
MLSVATPMFGFNHQPSVSSPLSSSPIRASSPLSPVDRNTLTQRQIQSSPIQQPKFKYASRPVRQNPLLRKREDAHESRRLGFLQGVRQKQDEKTWQRRDIEGQFLKNSLLADIGRLSYDAPALSDTDLEDAMAFQEDEKSQHNDWPDGEHDDVMDEVCQEEQEFEAMIASYEQQSHIDQRPPSPLLSDEDYDDVFAELIAQEQADSQPQSSGEQMDMS